SGNASRQQITVVLVPDLAQGEQLGGLSQRLISTTYTDYTKVALDFGSTFEKFDRKTSTGADLNSKRALVIVANRVILKLGTTVQQGTISDATMVETLIHEIAAHAGRISQGLSNTHGDPTVERRAQEVHDEFVNSKSPTASINVHQLLEDFYKK